MCTGTWHRVPRARHLVVRPSASRPQSCSAEHLGAHPQAPTTGSQPPARLLPPTGDSCRCLHYTVPSYLLFDNTLLYYLLLGYTYRYEFTECELLSHSLCKSCNSVELACAADSGDPDSAACGSGIARRHAPIRIARSVRIFAVARACASFSSQNLVLHRLLYSRRTLPA